MAHRGPEASEASLRIKEGRRGMYNLLSGTFTDLGPVFIVERPLLFAGQDIGEKVAEFDTRDEAEQFVARQHAGGR